MKEMKRNINGELKIVKTRLSPIMEEEEE